ncbi:unnamed protein product [Staurois parvus]|uniref:Uncharacterized protein n=1 Tax=Staurois parvus TaxID=386267 RepID=A0ABN9G997_9NEOB|nr:unnamed protein product [Staurois parvus]
MWGDQTVNCCFSVQELTGERTVLFTYSSLPPLVMLRNHWVPASNHRLGPGD